MRIVYNLLHTNWCNNKKYILKAQLVITTIKKISYQMEYPHS